MAFQDDQRETELFEEIERKWGRKIQGAFGQSVEELREQFTIEELATQLEQRGINVIGTLISAEVVRQGMTRVGEEVGEAITDAAKQRIEAINGQVRGPRGTVRFTFDAGNASVAERVRQNRLRLIREISDEQEQVIRNAVADSLARGDNPRNAARAFRDSIGLTQRQERAVQNFRRALQESPGQALSRQLRDRRFDSTLRGAAQQGNELTQEQVERMTERYRAKTLKHRSEVIARTESLRALSEGKEAAREQLIESGQIRADQVRRKWVTASDARVRENHSLIPGMNPEGVGPNEPFQAPLGPLRYPRDPQGLPEQTIQCRCAEVERITDVEEA